jgi:predicted HTH transcriptional regulator
MDGTSSSFTFRSARISHTERNGRIYIRIDAEVHDATREEISRLLYESGRVQYERLPKPEFREDGFSFVVTFRSISPRESIAPPVDPFQALLDRGEINERQYRGLLYARDHGTVAPRVYADLTGASARTAARDLADLEEKNILESAGGCGWKAAYRLTDRPDEHRAMIVP